MEVKEIEEAALQLTVQQRVSLARKLLESLDEQPSKRSKEDIKELWLDEAERRWDRLQKGEGQTVPAAEVFSRIRSKLDGTFRD